jgi:hypothetical protein
MPSTARPGLLRRPFRHDAEKSEHLKSNSAYSGRVEHEPTMPKLSLKTIFLLDGIGAIGSACVNGLLLPMFSEVIGFPRGGFYALATFALGCAIYSLTCYRLFSPPKPGMLLAILIANLAYCLAVGGVILFSESLQSIGKLLFFGEILVVLLVVGVELKIYREYARKL